MMFGRMGNPDHGDSIWIIRRRRWLTSCRGKPDRRRHDHLAWARAATGGPGVLSDIMALPYRTRRR